MTKLSLVVRSCLLLLTTILPGLQNTSAAEPEADQWAVSQHDEGPCTLRGRDQGLRLWFGEQLTLKCSFHVYSHKSDPGLKWVDAGGTVTNENGATPRYYAHHLAFLDADDNLITCVGDSQWDHRVEREPQSRQQDLPIPAGCEARIARYKSAFYESDKSIGIRATPGSSTTEAPREGDSDKVPIKMNTVHRPLFEKPPNGVHVYTVDGHCQLLSGRKRATENPPILIGEPSHSQAKVYFGTDNSKEVSVHYSLTNHTESSTHQDLYIAFFDDHGHLVASTSLEHCATRPKETTPSLTVKSASIEIDGVQVGKASVDITKLSVLSVFHGKLPLNEYKKISGYKMTMYVYDKAKRRSE